MKNFLNPKKEPLTIEKLKTFKGMENLTDEEAEQTLLGIKLLSTILIDFQKNQEREKELENSLILNQAA